MLLHRKNKNPNRLPQTIAPAVMIGQANPTTPSSCWNSLQNKLFEMALVMFPADEPDRWEKIAGRVPGKTAKDVCQHYEALVHDVWEIDAGRIELPAYTDDSSLPDCEPESLPSQISFTSRSKAGEQERKKGIPWTENEHKLFLMGLQKYGRGDWRSISRNAVVTRTPTQVASHAQKYFLRLNAEKKEKKRTSIHDITTVNGGGDAKTGEASWVEPLDDMVGQVQPGLSRAFVGQFPMTGSSGFGQFQYPMENRRF